MFKLFLILFVVVLVCLCTSTSTNRMIENYTDPIWSQPHKLYADYYPRTNGSIYGDKREGWDIFSGIKYYGSAY